jgi:site-specific recombinase XerD
MCSSPPAKARSSSAPEKATATERSPPTPPCGTTSRCGSTKRPHWPSAQTNPALLLNRRGGRLSTRAADQILGAIADDAKIEEFTPHVLRHTFGTRLVREGHDLVVVAELLGHARLDQTRCYSLPTQADRQRAINSLLTDN